MLLGIGGRAWTGKGTLFWLGRAFVRVHNLDYLRGHLELQYHNLTAHCVLLIYVTVLLSRNVVLCDLSIYLFIYLCLIRSELQLT